MRLAIIILSFPLLLRGEFYHSTPIPIEQPYEDRVLGQPTTPAAPQVPTKEKKQAIAKQELISALKNPNTDLKDLFKEQPSVEAALQRGDEAALKEIFGNNSDVEIQQLKARFMALRDPSKLGSELDAAKNKNDAYSKALKAEAEKLVKKHQKNAELYGRLTGTDPAIMATKLETWQQMIEQGKHREAADSMSSFIRSVPGRAALSGKGGYIQSTDSPLDAYLKTSLALSRGAPLSSHERLTFASAFTGNQKGLQEFVGQFQSVWPSHERAIARYNQLLGQAVGPDGTVNPAAMAQLKSEFPGFNANWAFASGNTKALWLAGYNPETKQWSYTTQNNILDTKTKPPITVSATQYTSLNTLYTQPAPKEGPHTLTSVTTQVQYTQTTSRGLASIGAKLASADTNAAWTEGVTMLQELAVLPQTQPKSKESDMGPPAPPTYGYAPLNLDLVLPRAGFGVGHSQVGQPTSLIPPLSVIQQPPQPICTTGCCGNQCRRTP